DERIELGAPHLEERLANDDDDVLPRQRRLLHGTGLHGRVGLIAGGEVGREVSRLVLILVHLDVAGVDGRAAAGASGSSASATTAARGLIHLDLARVSATR